MGIPLKPIKTDDWLMRLEELEAGSFPLSDILTQSLFYPASGLDTDPVKYLSSYTTSFVYCDYALSDSTLVWATLPGWISDYRVILQRSLSREDLAPNGFRMPPLQQVDGNPNERAPYRSNSFFRWLVLERSHAIERTTSPRRISILILGVDGVAALNELYVSNRLAPAAIAVIQPGHHMGGMNYTNFDDPNQILARLVLRDLDLVPDILMFGGNQDESHYTKACWPHYRRLVQRLERSQPGHLGIWTWRRRRL